MQCEYAVFLSDDKYQLQYHVYKVFPVHSIIEIVKSSNVRNVDHNIYGPAEIVYDDGYIISVCYCVNDLLHNENGPAVIEYGCDGAIVYVRFYINGVDCTGRRSTDV